MNNEPIPSEIREHDNRDGKTGSDLRKLGDTRLQPYRPLQPVKPERAGKGGSNSTKKPRDENGVSE